ncbi:MAG: hypothetical protein AB9907_14000 [Flexilinea sp.]
MSDKELKEKSIKNMKESIYENISSDGYLPMINTRNGYLCIFMVNLRHRLKSYSGENKE